MPAPAPAVARAYVTVLSTDGYLPGVLALARSLRRTGARHPLHVVVGGKVGRPAREALQRAGLTALDAPALAVPEEVLTANRASDHHRHWAGVFEKLVLFSLPYERLVYLDSDMLVVRGLDELFERPHLSAVLADVAPGVRSRDLNAGLMVLDPRPGLTDELVATLPAVYESERRWREAAGRPPSMGVQSVINAFWPGWYDDASLHLPLAYNALVPFLDDLGADRPGWRGRDGVRVLHFIGQTKPFMLGPGALLRTLARLARRRRWHELAATAAYAGACAVAVRRA